MGPGREQAVHGSLIANTGVDDQRRAQRGYRGRYTRERCRARVGQDTEQHHGKPRGRQGIEQSPVRQWGDDAERQYAADQQLPAAKRQQEECGILVDAGADNGCRQRENSEHNQPGRIATG